MINTKLLQQADYPTSYHQLATDPKYRGKIAWVDPRLRATFPASGSSGVTPAVA